VLDLGDLYDALFDHSARAEIEMKFLLRELEVCVVICCFLILAQVLLETLSFFIFLPCPQLKRGNREGPALQDSMNQVTKCGDSVSTGITVMKSQLADTNKDCTTLLLSLALVVPPLQSFSCQ